MASIIQPKPCLLSPHVHFMYQHNLPSLSKVLNYSINCAFPSIRISSINFTFNFLDYSDKERLNEHPYGFMMNQSLINVEDATALIRNYVADSLFENTVEVYLNLLECSYPVEQFRFFPTLIKAFGGLYDIKKGRQIHGHVLKLGALEDTYIVNSLLGMYFKLGETADAVQLFEKMSKRDTVSWNTMISGYSKMGDYEGSLVLLKLMVEEDSEYPNQVACLSALSSVASIQSLTHGQEIHAFVIKRGLAVDDFLASGLIDMYMKCRNVYAECIFRNTFVKETIIRNTVIWNVMISGYVLNDCFYQGLHIFLDMLEMGLKPDHSTIVAVLVLCSHLPNLTIGKQINGLILSNGLLNDSRVETALLDMYFRCGDPRTGLQIFYKSKNKNLVMWSAVITNSAQCGYTIEALNLFSNFMLEYGSVDSILLVSVLRLCSSAACMSKGKELHGLAIKIGIDSDGFVGGALVDMYAKCRDVESAEKAFYNINYRDLVSWNSLLSGYAQNDFADQALKAFRDMQSERILPNNVTIAFMLSVCAHLSIKMLCKEVYSYVLRRGLDSDILVCNSLITTFAKCGDISGAWVLFKKMPVKDQVSWNSIILGFGLHGLIDKMSTLYEQMKDAGIKPDHTTFTAVLSACSHAGRLDMGLKYFQSMVEDYKLEPHIEQYTCMVDLLRRAGHLKQAYDLILVMPCVPDDHIWGSLLGSCKIHGNEKLGELVANHIFNLDPTSIGYRILLANLYEDFGKWKESTRMRSQVKEMRFKKQPGCSWIEVNNSVHIFVAGDHSHSKKDEIYSTIASLTMEMRREGYIPQTPLEVFSD